MNLLRWMLRQHRGPLLLAGLLSALSASLSVGVIAFVNERFIQASA
jgi:ABC-type siderophore export system fused ATPase/permease subunit